MTESSPEWDSAAYHRVSTPQVTWGKKVLARLALCGDETVLDAGCGTGLLTADLLELLPRGRVVCLDLSAKMLVTAREHLAGSDVAQALLPVPMDVGAGPQTSGLAPGSQPALTRGNANRPAFVQADLSYLPFAAAFDGVFSTAAFHWVLDHDRLFRSIHQALRPGGWLCAQCGGGRNLKKLLARVTALSATPPYSQYLAGYQHPWEFSDAETAAARLRRAGFIDIDTSLEPAPTRFHTSQEYCQFVATAILRTHLAQVPDQQIREGFLNALALQAAADDPPYELDYWRLNLYARKPA